MTTDTACPVDWGGYYKQACATNNPFWNCGTKDATWSTTPAFTTDAVNGIEAMANVTTKGVTGYVQAKMNGTQGTSLGNNSYISGCPFGMAYCNDPTSDGMACKSAQGWQCVFDPTFLKTDETLQKSTDQTNISFLRAKDQQGLYNLAPSSGPATLSVLRPRVNVLGAAGAACACTETGMLPPRASVDQKTNLCSLDSPCFGDSPGPYTIKSDGIPTPNTATKCAMGGVCAPIMSSNNYSSEGDFGAGGGWTAISATDTDGERYVRTQKQKCTAVGISGTCEKWGDNKTIVGFDPTNDLAVAGNHSNGNGSSKQNETNSCNVPHSDGTWGGTNEDIFSQAGVSIDGFCKRWKSRKSCLYGSASGEHFVAFGDSLQQNKCQSSQSSKPVYGILGTGVCPLARDSTGAKSSCGKHEYKYYDNAEQDGLSGTYKGAKASEAYISQHEVCQFTGLTDDVEAVPNPFLRVWAVGGAGLDASDSNLYPSKTASPELIGTRPYYYGTLSQPIPMEGCYADISSLTCGSKGEPCSTMWCGFTTMLETPSNPVDPVDTDSYGTYSSLEHGLVGFGHSAAEYADASTPPDRLLTNVNGQACQNQYYRYYAPMWMGSRGLNTEDGYVLDNIQPDEDFDDDMQTSMLSSAQFARERYYKRYPQLMRGALIGATGPIEANGTDPDTDAPYDAEYISVLDGTAYCSNGDCTADQNVTAALTPVTRCTLDLDRMLGLGNYDASSGVWTPSTSVSYQDRVNTLRGTTHTTGGPEQMSLSEQDLLQLWYTMRLDMSLGGNEQTGTACQSLEDICSMASADAWGVTDATCDTLSNGDWYDNYNGTLGPLVNMCSFAAPQYTDLMTLRANFKTFASVFHHVMKNVVRGVGAFELDTPVLDSFQSDLETIQTYKMNQVCANASTSDTGNTSHLGCSLPIMSRGTTSNSSNEVKSIGDLAKWYWATLTDDMKEDMLSGVCKYDPVTGEQIELSCNSDGTTSASQFQDAYLPECRSMNREGDNTYCAMKELTSLEFVEDTCWYSPSVLTSDSNYFCIPEGSTEDEQAWKTPSTLPIPCVDMTVCIQTIDISDITAGGNIDINALSQSQCCTTNIDGESTGDGCEGGTTLCPLFSSTDDDPQGLCSGGVDSSSCTTCVNPKSILDSDDSSVVASCGGSYTTALFPTSKDDNASYCQAVYKNSDNANALSKTEQLELACKVCGALEAAGSSTVDCSGIETQCDDAGMTYGM